MRRFLAISLIITAFVTPVVAQPLDGNVVLSVMDVNNFTQGLVVYFDPASSNPTLATLSSNILPSNFSNWIQMASNNTDVAVAEVNGNTFVSGALLQIDPSGVSNTIGQLPDSIDGFELDGDDTWILAGSDAAIANNRIFGMDNSSGTVTTFFSVPTNGIFHVFNEVAIFREGYHYAVGYFTTLTTSLPKIVGTDRSGIITTIQQGAGEPLLRLSCVEVDPMSGDLLAADFNAPEVSRVLQNGTVTPLTTLTGANAIKVNQDNTIYAAGYVGSQNINTVLHYDLLTSTVITLYQFPSLSSSTWGFSGIDVYGSRVLTCNGQGGPGKTVNIAIKSQNRFAAGAGYQLAASFGRRPGLLLPNGEWLHLNVLDTLFMVTAQNLLAGMTKNFGGILDAFGAASASIDFPAGFPSNLGITMFISGVVFNQTSVIQAMNTHWFEL